MIVIKKVFGIEDELFLKLPIREKRQLKLLSKLFVLLVFFSLLGGGYMGFLVSSNVLIGIVSGGVLGFIFYNILRFSLASIERSYSSSSLISVVFSAAVKLFFVGLLAFGLSVSFSSLLLRPFAKNQIVEHKMALLEGYKSAQENTFKERRQSKIQEIELIEKEIGSKIKYNSEKREELALLLVGTDEYQQVLLDTIIISNSILRLKSNLNDLRFDQDLSDSLARIKLVSDLAHFNQELNSNEQVVFQLWEIGMSKKGKVLVAIMLGLVFYLVIRTTIFAQSRRNTFGQLMLDNRNNIISKEYFTTKAQCNSYLKRKYGYENDEEELFLDPPFNTVISGSNSILCSYSSLSEYLNCQK